MGSWGCCVLYSISLPRVYIQGGFYHYEMKKQSFLYYNNYCNFNKRKYILLFNCIQLHRRPPQSHIVSFISILLHHHRYRAAHGLTTGNIALHGSLWSCKTSRNVAAETIELVMDNTACSKEQALDDNDLVGAIMSPRNHMKDMHWWWVKQVVLGLQR